MTNKIMTAANNNNNNNNMQEQSTVSVKSEVNNNPFRTIPVSELERLDRCREQEVGESNLKKHKSMITRLLVGLVCCVAVSFCFTTTIESSHLIYKSVLINGTQIYSLRAPSFITYFCIVWNILLIPMHLSVQYLKKKEKSFTFWQKVKRSVVLFHHDHIHLLQTVLMYGILLILWHAMLYCLVRGCADITAPSVAAIFCFNSPFSYLLYWIILHKKFIAIRILSFLLCSSGIIINVYSDQSVMWSKILITTSASIFSVVGVILNYFKINGNSKDNMMIYGVVGILNSVLTWPIFLCVSILTDNEVLIWSHLSWEFLFGISFGIIGLIISLEIANLYATRFTRSLHFIISLPLSYAVETLWVKRKIAYSAMEIASIVMIVLAIILNAVPHQFLSSVRQHFFPVQKVRQMTGRRVSMATRSQLIGNGSSVLHSSFNQSHQVRESSNIDLKVTGANIAS